MGEKMSIIKTTSTALMLLIGMAIFSAVAFSAGIPVTIDDVKVNGDSLSLGDSNRISVERGEELEIKVILTANASTENVQVKAQISGYEYDYAESVSDKTKTFNMDANSTHRKMLYINLPVNVEEDSYKLRIIVSNRDDRVVVQNYNLKIDALRHSMDIMDILLSPANEIAAGKPLLAAVRVKNLGERDEESVKVTVSMPELGISASDYIDKVNDGDAETSEELFLQIPECAEAGVYDVAAKVAYDGSNEHVSETVKIKVVEGDSCVVDADNEDEADEEVGSEAGLPDNNVNEEYNAGDNAGFLVNGSAGAAGGYADEADEGSREDALRTALEIALIGLIILLVIAGLAIGFMNLAKEKRF